jgi:hypothetical protein
MKKLLFVCLLLLLTGCTTRREVYIVVQRDTEIMPIKEGVKANRFTDAFKEADKQFNKNLLKMKSDLY